MILFPFFENIEDKTFLIIGGGNVAKGKVARLKQFTDNIVVVAKKSSVDGVRLINKEFEDEDIDLADYVIGATDDRTTNERIYKLCMERNIPVNIVDNPSLCTFIFPSLIKKGDLTIGITSSGKSPLTSQYIRDEIESVIPDNIEGIIDEMNVYREQLKLQVPDQAERKRLLKEKLAELLNEND